MVKSAAKSTNPSSLRPPVVAILGHVDHGKTSLLDAIRKTNVAAGEHGGITQAIGAFTVDHKGQKITFIDTPGHEAFSKMRSRGVTAADIAVLVVAVDDGVAPQTKESISHIQAAKTPTIVALTKSDVKTANPEKVKQQLLKEGIALEGQGGDTPVVLVSSKTGSGITELLEVITLVAQMGNIGSLTKGNFEGVVIEAKRDRRKGALATVIIRNGTLSVGEEIRAEDVSGKVRALLTDLGQSVKTATAGTPVEILGFAQVPRVGAKVVKKQDISMTSSQSETMQERKESIPASQDDQKQRLSIILKADTQGSLEAIKESISKEDIVMIFAGSGDPTEADVLLAKASNAIIVAFNVTVPTSVVKLAETDGVLIKTYKLIYELLEELEEVVGLFKQGGSVPTAETIVGKAQIMAIFPFEKKKVAGSRILEGRIARGDNVRIERKGEVVGQARVASLRRGKDDVGKVEKGSECGILLSGSLDFEPQDVILSVR